MAEQNPLWALIQTYMDDPSHRYPPKPADISRETGVSDQVLSKWKTRPTLPTPEQLKRLADGTGIPYVRLLDAALHGRGYLPDGFALGVLDQSPTPNLAERNRSKQLEGAMVAHRLPSDDRPVVARLYELLNQLEGEPLDLYVEKPEPLAAAGHDEDDPPVADEQDQDTT